MKKFLPFENITYSTKLETEEILKRINDNVELEKRFSFSMFFGSTSDKPYEGSITGKTFNLIRTIKYRNSFLPRAKGKIEQDVDRSKVNAKMNLHPVVLVLMLIWCGEVGIGFISIVIESIEQGTFDKMVFIPLVMLLFGYGMTIGGFKFESIRSKKFFAKLLEVELQD